MKIYILESKGEILGMLTHKDNKSYLDFKSEVEEAKKESDDFFTVKGILTSLYGYEVMELVASCEVSKRRNGF
ncbi:MAG: hypothetical protein ACRDB0_06835 [Paraclostridium sp.]